MFHERAITDARLKRVWGELIRPQIWSPAVPFTAMAWTVPANSSGRSGEPVSVEDAVRGEYSEIGPGGPWGTPWGTTWFKFHAVVPDSFEGRAVDAILNLGFSGHGPGFQAEGLIWERDPERTWRPRRGLHPQNHTIRVADCADVGQVIEFFVEAASNPALMTFVPDPNNDITTAGTEPIYRLGACRLAVVNIELLGLHHDYRTVNGWLHELPTNEPRQNDLLAAVEASLDALDPLDVIGSAADARAALAPVLSKPAVPSAHRISAIGHAHIDSAWLWPVRETIRKCARTFSNVLRLMEDEPEFKFGCSQAVQYEWMRQHYPSIFDEITEAVERGQWIPIGGQWVEADGNITGGESHIRQLLHGQRYFRQHFGKTCTEVWIPDVFGYPATLPQFFRLGGAERFLTQKLSWNRTNRFPHHTFWWEGIDGSRVYTHFPPGDNYSAAFEPRELMYSVHNFKDHGASRRSLMPFGFGDGGGGPSPDMFEQYHRSKNLEGSPRIAIEAPSEFFDQAMAEYPEPPVWVGELYFEMHRGSYTSQARTKVGNRRCEIALREAELWATTAFGPTVSGGYPADELDALWKIVLLNQFHDILPGTSIGWVHREAEADHLEVGRRTEKIIGDALDVISAGENSGPANAAWTTDETLCFANSAPFERDEVVVAEGSADLSPSARTGAATTQRLSDGRTALRATIPPLWLGVASREPFETAVVATERSMSNGYISVGFNDDGSVASLIHLPSGREVVERGARANVWQLHHDLPLEYDAWDIENYYRKYVTNLDEVDSVELLDFGPLVARMRVKRRFRSSSLIQTFELRAGSPRLDVSVELDWQERDHLLKVAWPVKVTATDVVRHIQYGHIRTPIHTNTTWDTARFELCAHHWIDIGEPGFGVALLNNGRYGHDITRTRAVDGSPTTTMRLTVIKGAQFPDPLADLGAHEFTYSIMPNRGDSARGEIIAEGYKLNMPIRVLPRVDGGSDIRVESAPISPAQPPSARQAPPEPKPPSDPKAPSDPLVRVDDESVIVEVVKAAEDQSGDLIIRVWESLGTRVMTTLKLAGTIIEARLTDALEDGSPPEPSPDLSIIDDTSMTLSLGPFQIATIRLKLELPAWTERQAVL